MNWGILKKYLKLVEDGIIEKYLNNEKKDVKIVDKIKNND